MAATNEVIVLSIISTLEEEKDSAVELLLLWNRRCPARKLQAGGTGPAFLG